jgi:hypothetical protein
VKLRLRSPRLTRSQSTSRAEHLQWVTANGRASFELQVRRLVKAPLSRNWETVCVVDLVAPVVADQAQLRFSPFHDGAGLRPVGFVHSLRVATYASSQAARPAHAKASANS